MQVGAADALRRKRVLSYPVNSRSTQQRLDDIVAVLPIIGIWRLQRFTRDDHQCEAE